jgi:NitT/TauT family transport system substrate-binding protein
LGKIPPEDGHYPLTILVANDDFIKRHKDLVLAVINGKLQAIDLIRKNLEATDAAIGSQLKTLTGKGLESSLIKAAIDHLELTDTVSLASLETMAQVLLAAGYLRGFKENDLKLADFLDLSLLQEAKARK